MDRSGTHAEDARATTGDELARIIVALACFGAAAVHLAFAPAHFGDGAGSGMYFLVLAWLQIACGAALLTQFRRVFAALAFVVNSAAIGVWIAAKLSGDSAFVEPVGFADAIAVTFATLALVGVMLLFTSAPARVRIGTTASKAWIAGVVAAVVTLLSASVTPALPDRVREREVVRDNTRTVTRVVTRDIHHDAGAPGSTAGDHGQHGSTTHTTMPGHAGHDDPSTSTTSGSHDQHPSGTTGTTGSTAPHGTHGGNGDTTTTTGGHGGHGDTTTTMPGHDHGGGEPDWETLRREMLMGGLDPATEAARLAAIREYLANQIMQRSSFLQGLPPGEAQFRVEAYVRWTLDHALDTMHGEEGGNHTEGPMVWKPMDPASTATLQSQLRTSATVIARYPTARDAMNAGYFQVTPWMMGIGAHYLNPAYISAFDPANPAILLFNGNRRSSVLVGVSYAVLGDTVPEGFAGPNDEWHQHPALCILGGTFVIGADHTPANLCALVGGEKSNGFFGIPFHMMHLWQVPGWESGWGLFSGENPSLNLATTDIR